MRGTNEVLLIGGVLLCRVAVTVASFIDSELWKGDLPPFLCVFEHTKLKNASDYKNFTIGYRDACYYKESGVRGEIEDDHGKYGSVTLSNLKVAKFAAQDIYSPRTHSIPILFQTRWQPHNATDILKVLESVDNEIVVLNVSFYTILERDAIGSCSGAEKVVVGVEWCKWARVFSHHRMIGLPSFNKKGQCVVRRSDKAQHFLNMWNTGNAKDFQARCYGEIGDCKIKNDKGRCVDQVFMANGKGLISKMVLKKYRDNVTLQEYIDVNMIINFGNWTEEFPRMFANSHKECLYLGPSTTLRVQFKSKTPQGRDPPAQFYAFLVIAFFLGVVVIIALTLVVCTCSTKSFRLELWDFWIKRNAYMKYAKDHASEIAEQAADKRMEKQEALMGGMLGDI